MAVSVALCSAQSCVVLNIMCSPQNIMLILCYTCLTRQMFKQDLRSYFLEYIPGELLISK